MCYYLTINHKSERKKYSKLISDLCFKENEQLRETLTERDEIIEKLRKT